MVPGLSIFAIFGKQVSEITGALCVPFDKQCFGNELRECNSLGDAWVTKQVCEFDCSIDQCVIEGEEPNPGLIYFGYIIAFIIILLVLILFFKHKAKSSSAMENIPTRNW